VYSHIRIASAPSEIHAVRIAAGDARLVIGCDMIVAASDEAIAKMQSGSTRAVINADVAPTGGFTKDPDLHVPTREMADSIREACGPGAADFVDATQLATALMGDSIATNLFMVGYAWQKGLIPLGEAAILQAIQLNGAAVESNTKSFEWGRRAAVDLVSVQRAATPPEARPESQRLSQSIDDAIERRRVFLAAYQNEGYAQKYLHFVKRVRDAEAAKGGGGTRLTAAVARYLFKLMAYKDEYEVARLHTDTGFLERIAGQFEGDYKVNLHLAPPLWVKNDPVTGDPRKHTFGPWMFKAMTVLAKFKGLRGTPFDVFGYSAERRTERRLIDDYRKVVEEVIDSLEAERLDLATEIASIPELIRGYGPVKDRHLVAAKQREAELLERWRNPGMAPPKATIPIRVAA
jgi:indolepyruvate ferredoxin oxidoreductase